MEFAITAPRGLEPVLAKELEALQLPPSRVTRGATHLRARLSDAYRVCLWSRVANRVLLPLRSFAVDGGDALYEGIKGVCWEDHLDPDQTLAVHADGVAAGLDHSHFAALRTKDAIVDRLRERTGRRPRVDVVSPDLRVHLYLRDESATVSIDLAGESLHRRGYRPTSGASAPLKENLGAALLSLADWPGFCARDAAFVDPMCGLGTLPIEAALIATDTAPGLLRSRFGFSRWRGHDESAWTQLLAEARERDGRRRSSRLPPIVGFDSSPRSIRLALAAVVRAGLQRAVHIERRPLDECEPPRRQCDGGLLLVNPPYGQRLGEVAALKPLYQQLGRVLKQRFAGWTACVLSGDAELSACIGLRAANKHVVDNGGIDCRLLCYPMTARRREPDSKTDRPSSALKLVRSAQAQSYANRLKKNAKQLGRWAKRNDITCYRVYDADIPEYAAAVDIYEGWVHLQEYAPPCRVDSQQAADRLHDMVLLTADVLELSPQHVFVKVRRRQRGRCQYERLHERSALRQVREGGHRFWVNLSDYLDTGLFLDERRVRARLQQAAAGRHFLNLFCYTASATVYAAKGGARSSTSVDISSTYLEWADRNLQLNGIRGRQHRLERADCLAWLQQHRRRYGLIYLAPPTFSNSKRMRGAFDIQRDHVQLLEATAHLLDDGGELFFSTNYRGFKLSEEGLSEFSAQDISHQMLPQDFGRSPRIHRTWRLTRG